MIKNFLTLICILFILLNLSDLKGQSCDWYYKFDSQSEVDEFSSLLPNCFEFNGNIDINTTNNTIDPINNLEGLIQIEKITGSLTINSNEGLVDLKGLDSLKSIGGDLTIGVNRNLKNLSGLGNLKKVKGDVNIVFNISLVTLSGLDQLEEVHKDLKIISNWELENLNGLANLQFISKRFIIDNNEALSTLEGLGSGDFKGLDKLIITNNHSLENLSGLENLLLTQVSSINIQNNSSLKFCAYQSICDYLSNCDTLFLNNNASSSCNDNQKLEDVCASIDRINFAKNCRITLFPNPVNNYLNIQVRSVHMEEFSYEIYDMSNRFISQGQVEGERINLSGLLAGAYIIKLKTSRQNSVFRFVKN